MSNAKPFLKWVGGKSQLIQEITKYLPNKIETYYEPFIGAGAIFFHINPENAVINDFNNDLITVYKVIKEKPLDLIKLLESYKKKNSKEFYYSIRNLDRDKAFNRLSDLKKAARFIYMNKVGYNGLYRVNSRGEFNVPYGTYKNPSILDVDNILAVSERLNKENIKIINGDFELAVKNAKKGDCVYFDPPYDPINETSSFTAYQKEGFSRQEHIRLKRVADSLTNKGVKVIISNSNTKFINELYSNKIEEANGKIKYKINVVKARRNINSKGNKRGFIEELIIVSK